MKVTVLFGGPSAEREVSLVSGRSVIEGLKTAGHEVYPSDISPDDLSGLQRPTDVVFPVLHGEFGENGELQQILEERGVPFVGSGSVASRAGMEKDQAKEIWRRAGLPTPRYEMVGTEAEIADAVASVGAPCVVKPSNSGSSLDVYICKSSEIAAERAKHVIKEHGQAMIEQFVKGVEITVGILGEKPLSPIRITTSREFFDYQAKYVGNDAQHHFDLDLPADVIEQLKETARMAHLTLGCRDLSRLDFIVDELYRPWLLEINTLPGFTPKSLLPEAAAHDGIPFPRLVDRLVCRAYARGSRGIRAAI